MMLACGNLAHIGAWHGLAFQADHESFAAEKSAGEQETVLSKAEVLHHNPFAWSLGALV